MRLAIRLGDTNNTSNTLKGIQFGNVLVRLVGKECLRITDFSRNCVVAENPGILIRDYRSDVVCAINHEANAEEMFDLICTPATFIYLPWKQTIYLFKQTRKVEKYLWLGKTEKFDYFEILSSENGYGASLTLLGKEE